MLHKALISAVFLFPLLACEPSRDFGVFDQDIEAYREGAIRKDGVSFDVTYHGVKSHGQDTDTDENGEAYEISWHAWNVDMTVTARLPYTLEDTDMELALEVAHEYCTTLERQTTSDHVKSEFDGQAWIFYEACR